MTFNSEEERRLFTAVAMQLMSMDIINLEALVKVVRQNSIQEVINKFKLPAGIMPDGTTVIYSPFKVIVEGGKD